MADKTRHNGLNEIDTPATEERRSDSATQASTAHASFGCPLLLGFLVVVGAIIRVIATHNDLWLDELISLRIANAIKTPWQIFSSAHTDNNHYLNTLYLHFVKQSNYAPAYRYLSVVWGVALVPAGYWLLARRSQVEAVILAGLLACSYPLIHFSSEARGYSGAVLGSMLASAALSRWMAQERGKMWSFFMGLTYGVAIVFALLSHLTTALIWFPLAAGSFIILAGRPQRRKWIALWIALNVLPVCVLGTLYFLDLRFMAEMGGSPMTVPHGLGRLLALGLGWPLKDAATVCIVLVPLIGLIVWQLAAEWKSQEPLSILLGLIYLVPLVCVLVLQPSFFSPRYFLVILPFVYVGIANLLARLVPTRKGRIALGITFALFMVGQVSLYARFLEVGRGQFTAALQYMMQHTTSPQIVVASNQDFRSGVELAYFAPRVLTKQLLYVQGGSRASVEPEWYILHQESYEPAGPDVLNTPGQPTWYRVAYFGASELSGQAWTIYSRQRTP